MRYPLTALLACAVVSAVSAQNHTLTNPFGTPRDNEVVSVPADKPTANLIATLNGKPVPTMLETTPEAPRLWIVGTFTPGENQVTLAPGKSADKQVKVTQTGNQITLDNGNLVVTLPAEATTLVGPILSLRLPQGKPIGTSGWKTNLKLKTFKATITGDGTVFGKVRLRYDFEGTADIGGPAFAEIDVSLLPGANHVTLAERYAMQPGDAWYYAPGGANFTLKSVQYNSFGIGASGQYGNRPTGKWIAPEGKFHPDQDPELIMNMFPRWNQHVKDGWMSALTDDQVTLWGSVGRASEWQYPHDGAIQARLEGGPKGIFLAPTWRGQRYWFLSLQSGQQTPTQDYVARYAHAALDKLNREYILTWPGLTGKNAGGFDGENPFSPNINPTGFWRNLGRQAIKGAGGDGNLNTLSKAQVIFHPDTYGSYWLGWSPENPNFFTDFMKRGIGLTANLKKHPQFKELAQRAKDVFYEDVYHSITLPSGAGQECPGYQAHALSGYLEIAPLAKTHLGFDPTQWPQWKAAGEFFIRVSVPASGKRTMNPMGDTHNMLDPIAFGQSFGANLDIKQLKTEELQGFGVVFRNRAGTDRETYLAFKSGPNRGHYHGDQLAFHYVANGKKLAIDYASSYGPRAGQEHMHNRVAFSTDALPYANMDGYERILAFKTSPTADVSVGQVESNRLRACKDLPPEDWDVRWPLHTFKEPLTYRRTMVMVHAEPEDYFVIRDQYWAPDPINATYGLQVLSDKADQKGNRVDFGNLTVQLVQPANPLPYTTQDWSHTHKNSPEAGKGPRFQLKGQKAGEFISVLYPRSTTPEITAIPGGVKVGTDTITFAGTTAVTDAAQTIVTVARGGKTELTLTGKEIDLNRSQGEVGLFVPDAGYPFGDIPTWLAKQRMQHPKTPQ